MLESISCTCDRCDQPLTDDQLQMTMATAGGTRRVYECSCGAVTVTLINEEMI